MNCDPVRGQEVIFLNSVFFVIGFTIVFALVGVLFQTLLAHASFTAMDAIRTIGGSIILVFGVLMILSTRYIIPFFSTEHKLQVRAFRSSYLTSVVFGIGFALGWTPCVGAILGSIYALAATSPGSGFLLLLAFSLGLGIPFIIFGAFISEISVFMRNIRPLLRYFSIVGGLFLIALGILVITGYIGELAVLLLGAGSTAEVGGQLNLLIAIVAGALTFLSPCILPLLPAYFTYMVGTSAEEIKNDVRKG